VGGAIYFINQPTKPAEILPDHFGMFVQNREKSAVSEISRQDYSDALLAKDDLLKTDALPVAENKPNLILYSDGKDIPLSDLKLVQLDTIKDDGSLKQINFQTSPVEGKPEMKRLRIPDGLANGKYAFALFDGFLDEGKHKFWAFQIQNAEKSDNGDLAKAMTISPKPKPSPTPPPKPPPQNNPKPPDDSIIETSTPKPTVAPSSGGYAYCRTNNVVLRSAPSTSAAKVDGLYRGQKLYVISQSDNYETWRGVRGNWTLVQTENGNRGWVFSPLIRY
ncbi:MAG: SH3 domain-containing protein, partial [Acidobacteriota bacterium]|nr:SH3 domain-containing protein [Acidobacteriota bacterium]